MKTSKKDFGIFKKEVLRLVDAYSLKSWELHVDHEKVDESTLASTQTDMEARQCVITLNTDWQDPVSARALKDVALHEVLELLFAKVESFVCESKRDLAREEVHAIIQTFINMGER